MYNGARRYSAPTHLNYVSHPTFYEDLFNQPLLNGNGDLLESPFDDDAQPASHSRNRTPPKSDQLGYASADIFQLPQIQTPFSADADLASHWLKTPPNNGLGSNGQPVGPFSNSQVSPSYIPATITEEREDRFADASFEHRSPPKDRPYGAELSPAPVSDPQSPSIRNEEGPNRGALVANGVNPLTINALIIDNNEAGEGFKANLNFPGVKDPPVLGSPSFSAAAAAAAAHPTSPYGDMTPRNAHMYQYAQQQMMAQYMRATYAAQAQAQAQSNGTAAHPGDPYLFYKQTQAQNQPYYFINHPNFLTPPQSGNMSTTSSPLNVAYPDLVYNGSMNGNKMLPNNNNGTAMNHTSSQPFLGGSFMHGSSQSLYPLEEAMPLKVCSNCGCTSTPSWRRCPNGKQLLCNACGLYQKLHNKPRPFCILDDGSVKVQRTPGTESNVCSNCQTTDTPLWRRGSMGEALCNACGLYFKQHRSNMMHLTQDDSSPGQSIMVQNGLGRCPSTTQGPMLRQGAMLPPGSAAANAAGPMGNPRFGAGYQVGHRIDGKDDNYHGYSSASSSSGNIPGSPLTSEQAAQFLYYQQQQHFAKLSNHSNGINNPAAASMLAMMKGGGGGGGGCASGQHPGQEPMQPYSSYPCVQASHTGPN